MWAYVFVWPVAQQEASSPSEHENNEEQEQIRIARALQSYRLKEKLVMPNLHSNASIPFQKKFFVVPTPRPSSPQRPTAPTSKILPFFCQKSASRTRPPSPVVINTTSSSQTPHIQRFPAVGAAPYVPIRQCRAPYQGIAQPVTMRTAVPVFSAPPPPAQGLQPRPVRLAPPVCIRQAVPASAAAPPSAADVDESTAVRCLEQLEI